MGTEVSWSHLTSAKVRSQPGGPLVQQLKNFDTLILPQDRQNLRALAGQPVCLGIPKDGPQAVGRVPLQGQLLLVQVAAGDMQHRVVLAALAAKDEDAVGGRGQPVGPADLIEGVLRPGLPAVVDHLDGHVFLDRLSALKRKLLEKRIKR